MEQQQKKILRCWIPSLNEDNRKLKEISQHYKLVKVLFLFIVANAQKVQTWLTYLLKVNYFARSEFSLIKCCAELCVEIAIKPYKLLKELCQKYKKGLFYNFCIDKLKFCANSRKFCADMRLHVRAF